MKKLFVSLMAVAALVSCSKDESNIIETSKKAVEITISNAVADSRVIAAPEASLVTGDGQTGTIETQAANNYAAAQNDQLVVLFANNANVIEQAFAINAATTRFHDINESVTQVAIVRKATATKNAETGAWAYSYDTTPANFIGDNLSDYRDAALTEYADNRGVDGMDLFAVSGLGEPQGPCTVEDPNDHATTFTYTLYKASLNVAPMLARVEITGVSCTDLGQTTFKAANGVIEDGKVVTGGYDELVLGTIKFGANDNYTYDLNDFILKGVYKDEGEDRKTTKRALTSYSAGEGKAIAWNIATQTAFPLVASNAMTLDMVASAYDYTVVNTQKNLTIGFDKVNPQQFEPGKIYRLAINFTEDDLDASNEAICVEVTVTVANWVVVSVDPTFKDNN